MQKYLSLLLLACLTALGAKAQQRTITGTVKDAVTNAPLAGAIVQTKGGTAGTATDKKGAFSIQVATAAVTLTATHSGYKTGEQAVAPGLTTVHFRLKTAPKDREIQPVAPRADANTVQPLQATAKMATAEKAAANSFALQGRVQGIIHNTENYSPINENDFHAVTDQPLSTFSIDVDRASYSNVRRFLNSGQLPPADAVRVEEMINYFDYQYQAPAGADPVAIYTDMAICPWNPANRLVRIALKGKSVTTDKLPPSNLVFLIDVSGSMAEPNKLPLVKQALKALVQQLRPADKVAIVVYAGAAGMVLPATSGSEKTAILDALDKLDAGGSTAGREGIQLAYKTAAANFIRGGNNRIILATDGDFNVGISSDGELQRLIEKEREQGIFLSVMGFGMGNYKDNKLELLADKGNGNYAYIDNFEEARRIFVTEFGGTLFTIAKDVKLQLEFNPRYVQAYRLVGYENRLLKNEDFNNDKKDAGDMGAGHTVTALYEVVPAQAQGQQVNWVDPLKYQQRTAVANPAAEVLTVKLRYKNPDGQKSRLLTKALPYRLQKIEEAPADFRMCAAVAAFGQLLRNSAHKGQASFEQVLAMARGARGDDPEGYRSEFIQLVKKAEILYPAAASAY